LSESIAHFQEIGERWSLGRVLNHLGDTCLAQGAHAEARQHFQAALQMAHDTQAIPIVLDALARLADLLAHDGERELAFDAAAQIMDHPASTAEVRRRARRLQADLACLPQFVDAAHARHEHRSVEALAELVLVGNLTNQHLNRPLAHGS
jgi:hypothetical protein